MIRTARRLFGLARRSATLLLIALLITTNVLALTSAAFVGAVSAVASGVGVATVAARQASEAVRARAANRALRTRLDTLASRQRTVARRLVGRTVTRGGNIVRRLPPKVIPVIGVPAVLTFAVLDVQDACATLGLAAELDPDSAEAVPEEVERVCAIDFGSGRELLAYARDLVGESNVADPDTVRLEPSE